jgi:hypothetical protein
MRCRINKVIAGSAGRFLPVDMNQAELPVNRNHDKMAVQKMYIVHTNIFNCLLF